MIPVHIDKMAIATYQLEYDGNRCKGPNHYLRCWDKSALLANIVGPAHANKHPFFEVVLKLNTQYTHIIFFDLKLRRRVTIDDVMGRIKANRRIALTEKKSSAAVFSYGRDHGLFGRILNQTVIAKQSLSIKGDREIVGMCFTPQDGNSLLSSISATLWFLYPDSYKERLGALDPYFFNEI